MGKFFQGFLPSGSTKVRHSGPPKPHELRLEPRQAESCCGGTGHLAWRSAGGLHGLQSLVLRQLRSAPFLLYRHPMTGWQLHCQVRDDEIIVSLPGTTYTVTYYKPDRSPQLLARLISDKDDKRVALTLSQFLAQAWKAANDKARELGWIA